jgi:hypothetical protein
MTILTHNDGIHLIPALIIFLNTTIKALCINIIIFNYTIILTFQIV